MPDLLGKFIQIIIVLAEIIAFSVTLFRFFDRKLVILKFAWLYLAIFSLASIIIVIFHMFTTYDAWQKVIEAERQFTPGRRNFSGLFQLLILMSVALLPITKIIFDKDDYAGRKDLVYGFAFILLQFIAFFFFFN